MHGISFISVLYGNFVLFIVLYIFIFKLRRMIGFHLGMNIAIVTGGLIALTSGILLIFQYPFLFTFITILATCIGMVTGAIFGALFDYQTMLTGLINGLMAGIMAPMLGAIMTEHVYFMVILEALIFLMIIIIGISIRRS